MLDSGDFQHNCIEGKGKKTLPDGSWFEVPRFCSGAFLFVFIPVRGLVEVYIFLLPLLSSFVWFYLVLTTPFRASSSTRADMDVRPFRACSRSPAENRRSRLENVVCKAVVPSIAGSRSVWVVASHDFHEMGLPAIKRFGFVFALEIHQLPLCSGLLVGQQCLDFLLGFRVRWSSRVQVLRVSQP